MKTRVSLDTAGRIVIPRPLRDELHLEPGDSLEMESTGGEIILRPVHGTPYLGEEHGVRVFHTGEPLTAFSTEEMLEKSRKERDAANFGEGT